MRIDREYHHFKGEHLTRSEWVERFVVDELVHTSVSDSARESSQAWELMHSSTCKAFMHVLAEKRGVDVELARVAGALHDYYVIKTGKYKNHAQLGAPLVGRILSERGEFSESEIEFVCEMVANHSDKQVYSNLPHVELVKDADVFDCSLYYGTEFYYLTRKPLPVCHEYFMRVLRVREEIGMPVPAAYRCLSRDESGALRESGELIYPTTSVESPTAQIVALWALASSEEGKGLPWLALYRKEGVSRWFEPGELCCKEGGKSRIPDWPLVRRIREGSFEQATRLNQAAMECTVSELLRKCCDAFVEAWRGYRAVAATREKAAVVLRDFACDPKGDEKLNALVRQRVSEILDGSRATNSIAQVEGWSFNAREEAVVDELARLQCLAVIRGLLIQKSEEALALASQKANRDLLRQFPSDAFGCEDCPSVGGPDDAWLAVAWPRFARLEFVVGAEAEDRFDALTDYFRAGGDP